MKVPKPVSTRPLNPAIGNRSPRMPRHMSSRMSQWNLPLAWKYRREIVWESRESYLAVLGILFVGRKCEERFELFL